VSPDDAGDRVLPAGRLREPLGAARAADALLVEADDASARQLAASLGVTTVFTMSRRYQPLAPLGGAPLAPTRRVVAVAGIARPSRFFAALRQQGYDVAAQMSFRDHHWFTPRDVARIAAAARASGADAVVTTAKDAVRLGSELPRGAGVAWGVLPMEVVFDDVPRLTSWLAERLTRRRAGARSA
jgi:tetraacyldisaccharide 4'-kinase